MEAGGRRHAWQAAGTESLFGRCLLGFAGIAEACSARNSNTCGERGGGSLPHERPEVDVVTDARDGNVRYIGPRKIPVWPAGQRRAIEENGTIAGTTFNDTADYHPGLIARILELSRDQQKATRAGGRGLGTKVYHLERWRCPGAELLISPAMG